MPRFRRIFTYTFISVLAAAAFGMAVSVAEHGGRLKGLAPAVLAVARFPSHVHAAFYQMRHKSFQVLNLKTGDCGVSDFGISYADSNFILFSAYDKALNQSSIRLMRIRDGKVLHTWVPPLEDGILRGTQHKIETPNIRFNHPLLFPDGSLVTHSSYGPLFRLDKDSRVVWVIDRYFHHALSFDAEGNIWGCVNRVPGHFDEVEFVSKRKFEDNAIIQVSPSGEILYEKSVAVILEENHLRGWLLGAGYFEWDALHLNDAEPALYSTDYWEKGDILMSFRHLSMIMLYRPSTNKVVWTRMGDWINQHDPDFVDSCHISVFGNDMARFISSEDWLVDSVSNIYLIDLARDTVTEPYADIFRQQEIYCYAEGLSDILPDGRVFIEQTKPGRLIIANQERALWSYVECIEENTSSIFAWSRYLRRDQVPSVLLSK